MSDYDRVQCRIHGGYWHLVPVARTTETVTVELPEYHGRRGQRELRLVPRDELRYHENAAAREAVDALDVPVGRPMRAFTL